MLRHWSLCAISERSSCFMYKRTLSLYTPNTVESNDTCIGLRKSSRIINVIWYRGSSSGFGLSTGFASPLALSLSYTVNKHKSMTINTLFVTNLFNNNKHNKRKYMFWKRLYNMCQPNKEDVKGLPHYLNLLSGYKDASISISNFLNTNLHSIIAQRDIMDDCQPFINSSKGNQMGRIVINIQPIFVWFTRVWILLWGIDTTSFYADIGSRGSLSPWDCICDCIWTTSRIVSSWRTTFVVGSLFQW